MMLAPITALVAYGLRLLLHHLERSPEKGEFMFVHLLFIALLAFYGVHRGLRQEIHSTFPTLLRQAFRNVALYALVFTPFIWSFYVHVDQGHFPERIDRLVELAIVEGQPEAVVRERLSGFFTPFNYATLTLFGLLLCGAANALVMAAIGHKVLRRFMR